MVTGFPSVTSLTARPRARRRLPRGLDRDDNAEEPFGLPVEHVIFGGVNIRQLSGSYGTIEDEGFREVVLLPFLLVSGLSLILSATT